ncbi:MAG: carbohydrate-binding protein [Clostridia bacterium]|nr:carbohydrate-binding protein [Clostridia bacterium]MDD4049054.1 carbohydrate-binding protein [Clostridia bacterium]
MFKFLIPEKRINNKANTSVIEEGVSISPMPVTMDETVKIGYEGLLAQNGATNIFAHVGYGSSNSWDNIQDISMRKENNIWNCEIVPNDSRLNFCFHDDANNWDNNNGYDWSLTIHNGKSQ